MIRNVHNAIVKAEQDITDAKEEVLNVQSESTRNTLQSLIWTCEALVTAIKSLP